MAWQQAEWYVIAVLQRGAAVRAYMPRGKPGDTLCTYSVPSYKLSYRLLQLACKEYIRYVVKVILHWFTRNNYTRTTHGINILKFVKVFH